MQKGSARVAKLGQRRKVEGLVLSGPRVQIPSLAPVFQIYALSKAFFFDYIICTQFQSELVLKF